MVPTNVTSSANRGFSRCNSGLKKTLSWTECRPQIQRPRRKEWEILDRDMQDKGYVRTEAETGILYLQAKHANDCLHPPEGRREAWNRLFLRLSARNQPYLLTF
jgi:hypothetical protein